MAETDWPLDPSCRMGNHETCPGGDCRCSCHDTQEETLFDV